MAKRDKRRDIWVKQGKYKNAKGEPMILVLCPKTGATILELLYIKS